MSYRDRNRKLITLPSGATCTIRKLTVYDYVSVGNIPSALPDEVQKGKREATDKEQAEAMKRGLAVQKMIFTKCISPITFEGETLTVVDKPLGKAGAGEIEIDAWDQADAEFVALEVMAFSGMRKGVGDSAETFRTDENGQDKPAPSGEVLPEAAERVSEAAA